MTDATFKELDDMSKEVGRMVESAETHFGPVEEWTEEFTW